MNELVCAKLVVWQDPEILDQVLLERANKGANLLDEHVSDWPVEISMEELEFDGSGRDILQQLFDDPVKSVEDMGIKDEVSYYGFSPPMLTHGSQLKEAWREVIAIRLQKML